MAGEHYSETTPEITPQAIRQIVETEIEHLMEVLDYLDPDPDLEDGYDAELECEDEGAQCDDEGAIDVDREPDVDDEGRCHPEFSTVLVGPSAGVVAPSPQPKPFDWSTAHEAQARTTAAAALSIRELRDVMVQHGREPVPHLRVPCGAILKS